MRPFSSYLTAESCLPVISGLISFVFIAFVPWRASQLRGSTIKTRPSWALRWKIIVATLYSLTRLGLAVTDGLLDIHHGSMPDASLVLGFVASVLLGWLSIQEHRRSIRPSDSIGLYLVASSLCDAVWLTLPSRLPKPVLRYIQLAVGLLLLALESQNKRSVLLDEDDAKLPDEELSGILSLVFVWWIHDILAEGYHKILTVEDLPSLSSDLDSGVLRRKAVEAWSQRAQPETKTAILRTLFKCFTKPFLIVAIPRLSMMIFRLAQPVLVNQAIALISRDTHEAELSPRHDGYWIVCAAITIYVGLAVSTAAYRDKQNKLRTMVRGAVVGLIYDKTLYGQGYQFDEGRAVTLISTDAPWIEVFGDLFHDFWALLLECGSGLVLLAWQVGWLWPLPIIIIFLCSRVSVYVMMNVKKRRAAWNAATQQRVSVTSSMLGDIRNIKMLGLQKAVQDRILDLRQAEMDKAAKFRRINVIYNASANALGMFTPVITLVVYAIIAAFRGETLDTRTGFTTVAVLAVVTHSANMIMTIGARAAIFLACLERVHAYLLEPADSDPRVIPENSRGADPPRTNPDSSVAIELKDVTITNPKTQKAIIQGISLQVSKGTVVICSGAVGSGKSSLARAILGELAVREGDIFVSSKKIAFCAQNSWLPNRSIRDCIYGIDNTTARDPVMYDMAVKCCCLEQDLRELPRGADTVVGSKGLNLSGGQRQRVALARAVYSRRSIVILDDSFSSLDGKTESKAIENLLGPEGLFRKMGSTVLWITNSTQSFHLADNIIILADGTIKEQGSWESLQTKSSQISKLIHPDSEPEAQDALRADPAKAPTAETTQEGPNELDRMKGDLSLYAYYFRASGISYTSAMVICTITYSFFVTAPPYWLKWWTSDPNINHAALYISGYVLLLLLAFASTNGISWIRQMRIAPHLGLELHRRLVGKIMGAPLLYFSQNDSGVILNRFSQDINLVDNSVTVAFSNLCLQVFKMVMQVTILLLVQYYLSFTLPFCIAVVYIVQKVYLRTSRQLRIIEIEARSGLYSSFLETIQGISTIRAFGWQEEVAKENSHSLNYSNGPVYLLACLQRWLNIVLDLLIAVIAVIVIWLAVALKDKITGSQVGVALNLILVANSTLLSLVSSWTSLEISLGAIARLRDVERYTPQEDKPKECVEPAENWPSAGEVEFVGVTAAYNSTAVALRDISLSIAGGQTVVVCGRTGSGKSSLLSSLLRLLEIQDGRITVDGTDLASLPRGLIRQRCFVTITQDPFLQPDATLRLNLDPSSRLPDEALAEALQKTGLKTVFSSAAAREGGEETPTTTAAAAADDDDDDNDDAQLFDSKLSSLPTLSGGQTQLLALARALLQMQAAAEVPSTADLTDYPRRLRKPILLLDEATSSLDAKTEAAVYDVIQDEFIANGHTVIMVTHKLGMFADRMRPGRDKIVWMRDGRIERVGEVGDLVDLTKDASPDSGSP